jgi:glycosyltransferase involved in cell wall biosynthesis
LLVSQKPNLLFISPRFLFPIDSGGKIRTTQVLRGMKGGHFRVTLMMPVGAKQADAYDQEIASVCDHLLPWEQSQNSPFAQTVRRVACLLKREPVSVACDYNAKAAALIKKALQAEFDLVVFDYSHSAILSPPHIDIPAVLFTHNVEAEIFQRQWEMAKSPVKKFVWHNQYRKMRRYEKEVLSRFTTVVAVSERDRKYFFEHWNIENCRSIPTGVDTDYFNYQPPVDDLQVVFCGSMDSLSNIDGVKFFFEQVWPLVRREEPNAGMKVVGRNPPSSIVKQMSGGALGWEFSGFVDDVRPHVSGAAAFIIPMRVGGGTRIKAFEAMAKGCPVVSTQIGMEGLPVIDGEHFLQADTPTAIANHIVSLLRDDSLRKKLSLSARKLVEEEFGFHLAARVFEDICRDTVGLSSAVEDMDEGCEGY